MKRWKLWTSVASGALTLVSGTTYVLWDRPAADTEEVAVIEPATISPHAQPPEPLQDIGPTGPMTPFATPASFNEPTGESAPIVRGNDGAYPVRPTAGAIDDSGAAPAVLQTDESSAEPGAARLSDQPQSRFSPPAVLSSRFGNSISDEAPSPLVGAPVDDSMPSPPGGLPSADSVPVDPTFGSSDPQGPPEEAVDPSAGVAVLNDNSGATESISDGSPALVDSVPGAAAGAVTPADEVPPVDDTTTAAPPASVPAEDNGPAYGNAYDNSNLSAPPAAPPPAAAPLSAPPSAPAGRFGGAPRPFAPSLQSTTPVPPSELNDRGMTSLPDTSATEPLANTALPRRDFAPRANRLISNAPGERKLEGIQAPSLVVERTAPEEIQVGKPAKFAILVRNVGQVAAQDVVVTDQIPQGTKFISATPEVAPSPDGVLAWELGTLGSGEDAVITVELMPEQEGEIGSVAAVTFRTPAAVRTIATRPLLTIEHTGPAKVLIGEDVPFQITVTNPGTGIASDVVVEVDVPEGLAHDGGREIMSDRFDLRPNESRKIDLVVRAMSPGIVQNVVRAVGSGTLSAEHRTQLEIVAPQIQVGAVGPTRRFLDRPVKYQIVVANPGTAPAQEIQLVAHLPRGLKFTAADKKGQYDSGQHAVIWSLEELPEGEQGIVELTAIPTDTGEQKLHIEARAALGLEHQHEHTTVVEDITDLVFTVSDESVPIEIGSETTYQIRVANNGTKVARNVRLAIQVPPGLEITDADGPTQAEKQGDQILLQPLAQLNQNEEAVYRVTAKGTRAGDQILRVQLMSDEFSKPVTKEEITKVYSDK